MGGLLDDKSYFFNRVQKQSLNYYFMFICGIKVFIFFRKLVMEMF